MKKLLSFLLLIGAAIGQAVPSHVLVTEDLSDRIHPKVRASVPSTGADSYNVYEAETNNVDACPAFGSILSETQIWPDGSVHPAGSLAYVLDTTLQGGVRLGVSIDYPDDPNPALGDQPALKQVGGRGWCYAVSSVLNGMESTPSEPQAVWLGFSAYYAWGYRAACNTKRVAYQYPPTSFHPVLWYRDFNGVNHQFAYVRNTVIVDGGGNYEVEFHLPTIAMDGTPVPLLDSSKNGQAKYFVEMTTPDGYNAEAELVPYRQGDHVFYNQIGTSFVLGRKNYWDVCPGGNGANEWWQDVSY